MNPNRTLAGTRLASACALAALLASGLPGCANVVPPSNAKSNAKLTPSTGISRHLTQLPRPKARTPVAVYGFRDQTGQFKNAPDSAYSTLVTQGAATMLVKALEDSGWYIPVEREGLQNLLTERRIIRAIESPSDKGKPIYNLPNMMPASMIIEGGVIAYETNVRTGGKGASYLGIGASTQYRVDQVTVGLRSVDVRYGQILNTVSVTKTIYSYQFSTNLYRFISYQHLLQAETGYSSNEPSQLAVREAIEAAVIHLTVNSIRDRVLELADGSTWFTPVIQAYLAEEVAQTSPEPLDEDILIPMKPSKQGPEPVQPLPFLVDESARARSQATAERQPAARAPAAAPASTAAAPASPPAAPVTAGQPKAATALPTPVAAPVSVPAPPPQPQPQPQPQRAALPPPAAASSAPAREDIFNLYWKNR